MNEDWQKAIAEFACPFCGRPKGKPCTRVEATYSPPLPDLTQPHVSRLRLLAGPDPGLRDVTAADM